jgi:S-formylglutathione hydrolase
MRAPSHVVACVVVLLPLGAAVSQSRSHHVRPTSAPDVVLVNGGVFTGDTTHRWAEALAIRGDRIVAVGTTGSRGLLAPIVPTSAAAQSHPATRPAARAPRSAGQLISDTLHAASLEPNRYGDSPNRAVLVYLPPSYDRSPARRYPVIYLLHGYGSFESLWLHFIPVRARMDSLVRAGTVREMIIVMPDARNALGGSFYLSSATTGDWDDFIAGDLVRYIDTKYRTLARAESRGLAGISMGGYGALAVGMRHAGTVYGALYAMSPCCADTLGAIPAPVIDRLAGIRSLSDARQLPPPLEGLLAFAAAASPDSSRPPLYLDLPYVLSGTGVERVEGTAAEWNAHSLHDMFPRYARELKQLRGLAFEIGRSDEEVPPSSAIQLDTLLTAASVPHTFELFDGTHMSRADERFTRRLLPFFSRMLDFSSER